MSAPGSMTASISSTASVAKSGSTPPPSSLMSITIALISPDRASPSAHSSDSGFQSCS